MYWISKLKRHEINVKKKNSCYNRFWGVKFWRDHQSCNMKLNKEIKLS